MVIIDRRKTINKRKIKNLMRVLMFILPALIPLGVFWLFPMGEAIFMSFTDWDYMSSAYNIVGFENYRNIFSDSMFYDALKNTLVFTLGTLVPTIALGLLAAVILRKKITGSAIYKAIIFSPWVTPTVVISIVWSWIFEPQYGLANYILQLLNMPKSQWLQSSDTAMTAVILVTVWKGFGWAMIFYLTALERVPKELYEAAAVDGAGSWQKFKKITLPLISPTTFFLTIITTINSIQAYDQIQVLTQGGPSGSTRTILYLYYQTAFENFNIGEATSIAVIILLIIGALAGIQFIASKKWVHY
ncbi:multiple sugar transport system permease protein [Clostridium butyricum]|nr:multiple sugar transport system permease protein [Clostridium butyricum]